jgi:hypothetical protein
MTTIHLVLRYAHISMGMLALLSGAAAMVLPKGSRPHKRSGDAFFVSMLIMAASGTAISIFITPVRGNIMGGTLALYMVATAWATVVRAPGRVGRFEVGAALGGLAIAAAGLVFGLRAASAPNGLLDHYPAAFYFIFGGVALFAAGLDAGVIARGGVTGAARLTRHLWRMCLAMFMATSSFFLGQAKLFPLAVRESGVLKIPVILVVGALLWWLVRVRVVPLVRRRWTLRRSAIPRPT